MILQLVPCISDILYTYICIATGKQLTSLCTARRCCHFAFPLPSSCTWEISAQHVLSTWLGQQPPRHSPLWPDMKTPFKRQSKRNLELNRKVFICEYEWIYSRIYVSMMYQCSAKMCRSFRLTKSPSHNDVSNGWLGNTFWLRTAGCKLLWHAECMSQVERYLLSAVCPFRESTFELYLSVWRNKSSVQRLWRVFHAKLQIFKAIRNISQSNYEIWIYIII